MKLIAIDLDGTLLNEHSHLNSETINYIKEIKDQHLIVLATGRPFSACYNFYQQLDLSTPLITDNGGTIWFNKHQTNTAVHGISFKTINEIGEKLGDIIKSGFFVNQEQLYAINYNPALFSVFLIKVTPDQVIHVQLDDVNINVVGLVLLVDVNHYPKFVETIEGEFKDLVDIRFWGQDRRHAVVELAAKGISKLSAIKQLMHDYQITEDNVVCFGDGINDFEMISGLKHSVAMFNATAEIKEAASTVTEFDHADNGVIKHLKKFIK
jgi:Cof subfamily protein (haloacid dehalogenase superfamily)